MQGKVGEDDGIAAVDRDPLYDSKFLRELYFKVNPNYDGRFTVPVVWDKKTEQIVNNESSEIIRFFNSEFNSLLDDEHAKIDLYPESARAEIDDQNDWVYNTVRLPLAFPLWASLTIASSQLLLALRFPSSEIQVNNGVYKVRTSYGRNPCHRERRSGSRQSRARPLDLLDHASTAADISHCSPAYSAALRRPRRRTSRTSARCSTASTVSRRCSATGASTSLALTSLPRRTYACTRPSCVFLCVHASRRKADRPPLADPLRRCVRLAPVSFPPPMLTQATHCTGTYSTSRRTWAPSATTTRT